MNKTGLKDNDIERIRNILSNFPQIEKVLLYGSRAVGNYKSTSDIDLTLIGNNIDSTLQWKLEMELDDLLLPYKFDISIYNNVNNPEFKNQIDRTGIVFYEPSKVKP